MSRTTEGINAFNEIPWSDFVRRYSNEIKEEIDSKGKEYILGVDEEGYKNYPLERYYLESLEIDQTSERSL